MKKRMTKKNVLQIATPKLNKLLGQLRVLIQKSRQQVMHAVDLVFWGVWQSDCRRNLERGAFRIELDALPSFIKSGG